MEVPGEKSDSDDIHSKYTKLKKLAAVAASEYDELQKTYTEILTQHEETKEKLIETETKLKNLENTMEIRMSDKEASLAEVQRQRDEAVLKETNLSAKYKRLEVEFGKMQEKVSTYQSMLNNLSRYSTLVLDEFTEVKNNYEKESVLKQAAELYAYEMKTQRDASIRQSSVLMLSAASDTRLMEALLEIERLTKQHSNELREKEEKIKSLEETLEASSEYKTVEQLEQKLDISYREIERMKLEIEEMQTSKFEIEAENTELKEKITTLTAVSPVTSPVALPPPPLAPPPPPIPACPSKVIFPRKESIPDSPLTPKPSADTKQLMIQDAMKEMMDRIQSGKLFSPGGTQKISKNRIGDVDGTKPSAMNDLQELLTKLKDRRHGSVNESSEVSITPNGEVNRRPALSTPVPNPLNTSSTLPRPTPPQRRQNHSLMSGTKHAPVAAVVSAAAATTPAFVSGGATIASTAVGSHESTELQRAFNKLKIRDVAQSPTKVKIETTCSPSMHTNELNGKASSKAEQEFSTNL